MSQDLNPELNWLDALRFNEDGLIPAVAQDIETGVILMQAWMNRESLLQTVETGRAVYWSRSRQSLWRKGEESGHEQLVRGIRTDCDGDAILMLVEQQGGIACHTGRSTCFFNALIGEHWSPVEPILKDPKDIYQ